MPARLHQPSVRRFVLAALLAASLLAGPAGAAEGTPGKPAGAQRQARVAQGGVVALADSRLTAAELQKLRPQWAELRPRVRTNAE